MPVEIKHKNGTVILTLQEADLRGINLRRANLRRANLRRTNLDGADLRGADLTDADLSEANLTEASLTEANLRRADLSGANLSEADLTGANLTEADLRRADLSGAKGLIDPADWLTEHFEQVAEGLIAYKVFGNNTAYRPPERWKVEPGSVIEEVVNPDRTIDCACGINVATKDWCNREYESTSQHLWRVLIRWIDLASVTVPYGTDGKFRAQRVTLLEEVKD
jgi:uncharacterized protein YjbI with pentapeptide repeats